MTSLMNSEKLKKVAALQQQLHETDTAIADTDKLMEQLCHDECQMKLHLAIHNETACQRARYRVRMANTPFGMMPLGTPVHQEPSCETHVIDLLKVASATRVINIVREELIEKRARIQTELTMQLTLLNPTVDAAADVY